MPFVPDRDPSPIPTPKYSLDTPRSAFGAATAEAFQAVGQDLKQSSNELYDRAMAMQQLKNQAEANDSTTQFMIQSGQMHANYSSKLGKDAVEGLEPYQKQLQELREQIGSGVSSPMAKKLYDNETKSTMGRTLFNAAGHAATQQKQWSAGSSNARIDAAGDQALAMPTDDLNFQKNLQSVKAEVDNLASIKGFDEDQKAQELAQRTSSLWEKRIAGLAKSQPFAAGKMLGEAASRGDIRGESIAKITDLVNQRMYTVGAREVSRDVNSGVDLAIGSSGVDIRSARQAIGQFESKGNYESLGPRVTGKDGTDRGQALGKYQVMPENLQPWLKQAGLDPMTPQEFLKNPKAQDAVFDKIFGDDLKKYGNFNDAASVWFTGTTANEAKAQGRNDKYTSIQGYLQGTNAILAQNASLADREARGRSKAQQLAPEDPLFEDHVAQRVHQDYNLQESVKRNDDFNNKQTVESGIVGMLGNGKLPTNVEELKATSPEASQAWDNLEPSKQRQYLQYLAKNAKGDRALTQDGLKRWSELKGMAQADPAGFLDTNILAEDLPVSVQKELINLQLQKKDKAEADPRVTHAMELLKPMLEPAGVTLQKDRPGTFQFMGALQDQMEQYATDNKKPADAKAINEIGTRLLQQQSSPNFWYGTDNMFKLPVPDAEAARIKALPAWGQLGITPTDDQVQRVFSREKFQDLYGGKPKAEAVPSGPQPPVSR